MDLKIWAESSPDAIVVFDSSARILLANSPARHLFGYETEGLVGESVQRILPALDLPPEESQFGAGAFAGEPSVRGCHLELEARRLDGTTFPVRVSLTPVRSEGSVIAVVIVQDISGENRAETERAELLASERAARTELERANRMKDDFLAVLSHELRTPLNAMLGWTQILRMGNADEEVEARALESIERNIRLQTQIIEDLLDMSSIVSGKLRLNISRTAIVPIIDNVLEMVASAAQAKGITLTKALDGNAGLISADPHRLQQVVWNLLSNAVKFTPTGGAVHVGVTQPGSFVRIEVRDTGQGIAADFLPQVFDRFRQANSSIVRTHGGLGLGLSIVKSLVEMHRGSIRVDSAGLGNGTTFALLLPVAGPVPGMVQEAIGEVLEPFPRHASPSSPDRIRGVRVLVVEDEPDARSFLERLLTDFGADVIVCPSAAAALRAISEHRPDVMLCDIGMPGEDGYQLIQKVRALGIDEGGATPAVALTAFTRPEDRRKSLEHGFQMHLSKPVEPMHVVDAIADLTKHR